MSYTELELVESHKDQSKVWNIDCTEKKIREWRKKEKLRMESQNKDLKTEVSTGEASSLQKVTEDQ